MPDNRNIGVLNEQGFVAGSGLGFNPIEESELQKDTSKEETPDNETDKN